MNKHENKKLAKLIRDYCNNTISFQIVDKWKLTNNTLKGFGGWAKNRHCHGAYLIRYRDTEYWFLFINWRENNKEYYLVIIPKDRKAALAEFNKVIEQKNSSAFEWRYIPRKQDDKNAERCDRFKQLEGTLTVSIALPESEVTLEDFLTNVYNVVDSRLKADNLDEDIRGLESPRFSEGKRILKRNFLV